MELNEKYCDIIIDRWEEYTGQKAVRVREGEA
jgi:DNA modification methylase